MFYVALCKSYVLGRIHSKVECMICYLLNLRCELCIRALKFKRLMELLKLEELLKALSIEDI